MERFQFNLSLFLDGDSLMFNSLMFSIECLPFFLSSRNCTHNKLCIISWIMLIPVNSAVAFRSAWTFLPCTSETVHLPKKSTSLSTKEGLKTLFPCVKLFSEETSSGSWYVCSWDVVRKMNIWQISEAWKAKEKLWVETLSQGHY